MQPKIYELYASVTVVKILGPDYKETTVSIPDCFIAAFQLHFH